jgi:long-chain acyl-CoA synthetase
VGAAPLTPSWHAERTPAAPAIVMGSTGETVTYAQLDDEREGREMLYSSGTTGRPKGVRKQLPGTAFGDPVSAPVIIARGIGVRGGAEAAVYLCPAPLYHSAPLVWAMSLQRFGATVVVMEQFDPRQCLELIERYRVTQAQFVPTMFTRLLRLPPAMRDSYDTSSLRVVIHGAAPCPVSVKRRTGGGRSSTSTTRAPRTSGTRSSPRRSGSRTPARPAGR